MIIVKVKYYEKFKLQKYIVNLLNCTIRTNIFFFFFFFFFFFLFLLFIIDNVIMLEYIDIYILQRNEIKYNFKFIIW